MNSMGILNIIVDVLNKQEEENGSDARWERLHAKPIEIVETPHGYRCRDIESGQFTDCKKRSQLIDLDNNEIAKVYSKGAR